MFLDMASMSLADSGIFDGASSIFDPPDIIKSTFDKVLNLWRWM
jgi:hypothetical protein